MSQEKSKTMPMQIFFFLGGGGGVKEMYYWICASSELRRPGLSPVVFRGWEGRVKVNAWRY